MLLLILTVGGVVFSHASRNVSAQVPSRSGLAQIATRQPTRHATMAATAASRPATLTPATPLTPTATQVAISPLLGETVVATQVVPLPAEHTGPHIAPEPGTPVISGIIASTQALSQTLLPAITQGSDVTTTAAITRTETPTITATPQGLLLLVPTPTPTPTGSSIQAFEQPIVQSGIGGIVATATAVAPPAVQTQNTQAPADQATELPTVTEADPVAEAAPLPIATIASQPTPDGNARSAHVPILMYHYLSVPPVDADAYRLDLSVTPDLFAAQLDAMQQAGYTTISLYDLVDYLTEGTPTLPDKPVIITFDDGYRDNYTHAFPLLRDRGLIATFFIVTDFINNQQPEYLTWDMVREMYAAGMSIEGHGRNHVSLANRDTDYLVWQALGTYESIEHEVGVRPHFICYPAGEYDQQTTDIFRSANYWGGITTQQGATQRSDDLFEMKRVRVRGTTSPDELLRLLALDW
jgi:peptidoglycan/xylan/chitin deacetylase (PgdA/CDA1 family)